MAPASLPRRSWRSFLLPLWGVGGVTLLLGWAIVRLGRVAVAALTSGDLGTLHWAALAVWVSFMAWSEGYRGFQRSFSPRTAGRALELGRHPTVLRAVLGPLYAMGYFAAPRRVLATAWGVTSMVVCLVLLVRLLDQPWRGIVDAGVVVGLVWGVVSLLVCFARGLAAEPPRSG